jgi:LysR family transcriptional regulator (chromosome initiation inhibitor)
MDLDEGRLAALAAVAEAGSFEAAARALHVTPSAVSQRIKALEQQAGQVLVLRSRPCRPTPAGEVLVRLAGQTALLRAEAARQVAGAGDVLRLAVAVNADSLSTWFPAAVVGLPEHVVVDLHREDQDHSAALLRSGSVVAAVTSDARPVQGCRVQPLGAMRYLPVAAPSFADRWFAAGLAAGLATAPVLTFNRKDALQAQFVRRVTGAGVRAPVHYVPSSWAFVELVTQGLGWGMVPDAAAGDGVAQGRLVVLDAAGLDVPLFWQHWRVAAESLEDLTTRVTRAARTALHAAPAF